MDYGPIGHRTQVNSNTKVIVFDVNETLSDLSPLAARFIDVGAPASLARLWFASVLRDGFALTVAGNSRPFAEISREVLRVILPTAGLAGNLDDAASHIMSGFAELMVHPDVVPAVHRLGEDGRRLVTLSNGAIPVAERLLSDAGVRDRFEQVLSVEDSGAWKPARQAYEYAARSCVLELAEMLMVAVHPWDIDGAARAGMLTAWLDRSEEHYPSVFEQPTYRVSSLEQLADLLS